MRNVIVTHEPVSLFAKMRMRRAERAELARVHGLPMPQRIQAIIERELGIKTVFGGMVTMGPDTEEPILSADVIGPKH